MKVLAGFALLVVIGVGASFYTEHNMQAFCNSVTPDASPDTIKALAKASGMIPLDGANPGSQVVVVNHLAPYFRFSCEINFEGGKVSSKSVVSAD